MRATWLATVLALALLGASPPIAPGEPGEQVDTHAIAAVTQYVTALSHNDYASAYALLTSAQQHYFGNVNNFASNARATQYAIHKFEIVSALPHDQVVEITVSQQATFVNAATGAVVSGAVKEPYFALLENGAWRVKQLYQPWKSYAPNITGSAQGIAITVHRIEFYDKRIQIDCTIRNGSTTPAQVLPLGKSVLDDGAAKVPALNDATFPLNDLGFFEGLRLLPGHQASGYINFPVARKKDQEQTLTMTVAPAIFDGAEQPFGVVVGPIHLKTL